MPGKTVRVEVRVGGTIQYSQDVASVSLERTDGTLRLTAVEQAVEAIEMADNPLIPPPPTPGAPDGHDEDTDPTGGVEVSQSVHDGTRNMAAEKAAAEARREARRQAAAQKATGDGTPTPSEAPAEGDSDGATDTSPDTEGEADK